MVTLTVSDTGQEIDILKETITYVKRVADIGDITKVNASYSWSFKIPKTQKNNKLFRGLSLIGSNSNVPYIKVKFNLLDNGFAIVVKGFLEIKNTKKYYNANLKNGVIDFYKDISDDKISEIIDLSELDHQNTINEIISTFDNSKPYKYIIASYNGRPLPQISNTTNVDPLYLIPSINVQYLWDKIMNYYGWKYKGDLNLEGQFLTYPNATGYEENPLLPPLLNGEVISREYNENTTQIDSESFVLLNLNELIKDTDLIQGSDNFYSFTEAGTYRITLTVDAYVRNTIAEVNIKDLSIFHLVVPDNVNLTRPELSGSSWSFDNETPDTITFDIQNGYPTYFFGIAMKIPPVVNSQFENYGIRTLGGSINVERIGIQNISFNNALIDIKVKDFFKEILVRQGLTVYPDIDKKEFNLVNVKNRINAPVLNWTRKYIERTEESYIYKNYARKNYFRHKYDQENQDFNDGFLFVNNENLNEDKDIFKSITFSPLQEFVKYSNNNVKYDVNVFKMFDREVSEDEDTGQVIATYKPLKNRYYFITSEDVQRNLFLNGTPITEFPLAVFSEDVFSNLIPKTYKELQKLLKDTKIHKIKLALTKWDVASLDLNMVFYFEQEQAYYILNKLTWKTDKESIGEFIKINK